MNNTNNMSARESFKVAKQLLYDSWIGDFMRANPNNPAEAHKLCWEWVLNRKLSQGEVRLEVGLTITSSTFTFGVLPTQANSSNLVFATENRLQQQDSLIVSEYGIYVAQTAGQNDTAFTLESYGNTQVFAAADAAALDSTFYSNGSFTVKVNNDVVVPYRGLVNHWYKPQTQQTAALGAGSPKDQFRGAEDGFITQEPNFLLIGSKNYVPQIVLQSNLASAAANLRAVLIFRGILAQNSTSIN